MPHVQVMSMFMNIHNEMHHTHIHMHNIVNAKRNLFSMELRNTVTTEQKERKMT
jgi:hypothetical protein